MARPEVVIRLRAVAVGGTAVCNVCTCTFAWKRPFAETDEAVEEQLAQLRCPRCRGTVSIDDASLVVELDMETGGGDGAVESERLLATPEVQAG